jgi:hypothetical protein
VAAGEQQSGAGECFDDGVRGSGGVEGGEQVGDGVLDGPVGVQDDLAEPVVGQTDG